MSVKKSRPLTYYRDLVRKRGHTMRSAAPLLGVHFGHLHHVLIGTRESASLLRRIEGLPFRDASEKQNKPQNQRQ